MFGLEAGIAEAIILGIVQGIAEFLPISSSGHIVIVNHLLEELNGTGMGDEAMEMNIALHVGSLFSIVAVYWRDLLKLLANVRTMMLIVVASVPVAIVGFTLKDALEQIFAEPLYAGIALLGTALILTIAHRLQSGTETIDSLPARKAWLIGLMQAFAVIPGISRSGTTISGGLLTGLTREASTRFSFFIAIPPIAGAGLKTVLDLREAGAANTPWTAMLIGAVTSFIVGFFALRWLITMVSRGRLLMFAWYCLIVGVSTIIWRCVSP